MPTVEQVQEIPDKVILDAHGQPVQDPMSPGLPSFSPSFKQEKQDDVNDDVDKLPTIGSSVQSDTTR